jgi:hypothetical protein
MQVLSRFVVLAIVVWLLCGITAVHARQYWYVQTNTNTTPLKLSAWDESIEFSIEFGTETLLAAREALPLTGAASLRLIAQFEEKIEIAQIRAISHSCTAHVDYPVAAMVGGYEIVVLGKNQINVDPLLQAIPNDGKFAVLSDARENRKAVLSSVRHLVAQVDPQRWFDSLQRLSAINRNSYSPALANARTEIIANFVAAGLQTSDFTFELSNITSCMPAPAPVQLPNVIGTKPGLLRPNEWVVIGAHYDSRNPSRCDGINAPQPGANDNASGCAGVMELARVFANVQTDRSMLFMCFSGEEQGLVGSRRYVDKLVADGDISKVKLMLNMDMIGHDVDGTLPARIETRTPAVMSAFSSAAATYSPELRIITSTTPNAGSDHFYFQQAGVPAVVTWENGASAYPHYHQTTDIPTNMTRAREMAGGILKMNTAALYDAAIVVPEGDRLMRSGFED